MTFNYVSKFLYRSSDIDEKYFEKILKQPLPFENTEYELRISGTVSTDRRIMSFIDVLWGFEVTGGSDQFEPLTILDVKAHVPVVRHSGYAFRGGIRENDIITRINNVYTDDMTLLEAQRLIRKSGKNLQIFVIGDDEIEKINEYTVDFWYKPKKRFPPVHVVNKWPDEFNWNDRRKPTYKESNCFMVPSKCEEKVDQLRKTRRQKELKEAFVPGVSDDNSTELFENQLVDPSTNGTVEVTNGESSTNGHVSNDTHAPPETDDKK